LPRTVLVGNDVVDLALPETRGKAADARFVRRVCAEAERDLLAEAADPDRALWMLWTAKETGYKVAKKRWPGIGFSPVRFRVSGLALAGGEGRGCVRYDALEVGVRWRVRPESVHCVGAWPRDATGIDAEVALNLGEASASRAARGLAGELLARRGVIGVRVERERLGRGWGPPRVWQGALPLAGCDLSLSHHGRWVAAAVWIREPRRA